jgi:hypothetical protein
MGANGQAPETLNGTNSLVISTTLKANTSKKPYLKQIKAQKSVKSWNPRPSDIMTRDFLIYLSFHFRQLIAVSFGLHYE